MYLVMTIWHNITQYKSGYKMTLFNDWEKTQTFENATKIIDQIDFVKVARLLHNSPTGASHIQFYLFNDDTVIIEEVSNPCTTLRGENIAYLASLSCFRGENDYLWQNYAEYCDDLDKYKTIDGDILTRDELAELCLDDCIFEEAEDAKFNLYQKIVDC